MKQFDLYLNSDKETSKVYPYFIDVQNDLLSNFNSRVVIPLTPITKNDKVYPKKLCPVVTIAGKKYVLLTHQMTNVSINFLNKKESQLANYRNDIVVAIDFLITGI